MISATVGRGGFLSVPAHTVLHRGAGPRRINKRRIDSVNHPHIRSVQSLGLLDASKQARKFSGLARLTVRIGEPRAGTVQSPFEDCVLETSFIDPQEKAFVLSLQKAAFLSSLSPDITGQRSRNKSKKILRSWI